ncbi:hypothetical protein NtRootA9_04540 [Arthrobacter sp. NtRootA9]|nr:hypothetical protein NtRootA9_04540 [Arthrobacter sp. NtRootA9]
MDPGSFGPGAAAAGRDVAENARTAAASPAAVRRTAPERGRLGGGGAVWARGGALLGVRCIKGETFLVAALLYRLLFGKGVRPGAA